MNCICNEGFGMNLSCPVHSCQLKQFDDNPPIGALARAIEELQPKPSEGTVSDVKVWQPSLRTDSSGVAYPHMIETLDGGQDGNYVSRKDFDTAMDTIERQAGEIATLREQLQRAYDAHNADVQSDAIRISQLEADLAAARLNERRYLWLRNGDYTSEVEDKLHESDGYLLMGKELDAAIDLAAGDGK